MKFIHDFNYATSQSSFKILFEKENKDKKFEYYYFNKFTKNKFFFKKTHYGVKFNVKLKSLRRNKNLSLNNLLINSWIKKGLKLNFLKNYNIFIKNWNFLMIKNRSFFKDQPNFEFVFDMIRSKRYNFNLTNLLIYPLDFLEHMFDLKLKKLNKKMKKKYKKKYIYTIKYLHQPKRLKYTLGMLYNSSNYYNTNKCYHERIFNTFLNVIFNTKNTPIWEKKLNTYKVALKFLKKK